MWQAQAAGEDLEAGISAVIEAMAREAHKHLAEPLRPPAASGSSEGAFSPHVRYARSRISREGAGTTWMPIVWELFARP